MLGNTWKYLEILGNAWKYLEILGNTWKYLDLRTEKAGKAAREALRIRFGNIAKNRNFFFEIQESADP